MNESEKKKLKEQIFREILKDLMKKENGGDKK